MFNKHKIIAAVVATAIATPAFAYKANKTYYFTVLHTNDTHGRFWRNDKNEYGFSAQKTLIDQVKKDVEKQNGSLLILHAGDMNTGVPESDMQNARPDIEAMNKMGYQAMALGNHEFDNPVSVLKQQSRWAKFPFLSANTIEKSTGKTLVKPYTIVRQNGLNFAIVGLTSEESKAAANPLHIQDIDFKPVIPSAKKALNDIKKNGRADVRIALTHLGYQKDDPQYTSDVELAQGLPEKSFDLIVGGHSHTTLCTKENNKDLNTDYRAGEECRPALSNGTWIVQTGDWGRFVGRADFKFKNGKTELVRYQLIPINLKNDINKTTLPENEKLLTYLEKFQKKGAEQLYLPVANIRGAFDGKRELSRSQQTPLGNLITAAQRQALQADLAILNGGAIRASLPENTVSYKDVLTVQPFGNTVAYVDFSGAELLPYLNKIAQHKAGEGNFTHFSANVAMKINQTNQTINDVKINGQEIDPTKTYRLVLPNYLAAGGDGFPKISNHPSYVDTGKVDADVLKKFLEEKQNLDVKDFPANDQIIYE